MHRRRLPFAALVVMAVLLAQAAPASADVFDDLSGGFSGPSISSDRADYAPGDTVVLSGSGWLPGEHVHITVNDDVGQTWVRESDVTADDAGAISDTFQLPDSFIARYAVNATGDASGIATTTFTDGNVKIASAAGRHFTYTATPYSSNNCTTGAGSPSTKTADANGSTEGVGNNESLLVTAALNANAPNGAAVFSNWTFPGSPAVQLAAGYAATDRTICVVGFQSGNRDLVGNYTADATPPTVVSINRADPSPTNTTGSVRWTVTFSESVTGVDTADFALVNTGLSGAPAITGVTGSAATYTVTASSGTGSGTLQLNLNDNDSIVDGANNKLGGTGTGTVGSGGAGNGSFAGQSYTIDRAAPTIAASAVTLPDNSPYTADTWTNKSVRVTFTCTDTGGSGKATDTASGNTDITTETPSAGTTVNSTGTCTDNAGNTAAGTNFGPVKIDKTTPSITDLGPTANPNANGWYKNDVVNQFRASDSLSGLNAACTTAFPDPVTGGRSQSKTTSGEGAAVKVSSSSCTDEAGNTAASVDSAEFKVDKTAPTISDLGPTSSPNANGWYKDDVTNEFKASDSLSGPDGDCETNFPDVVTGGRKQSKTSSGEGTDVKVSSDPCTDQAGNTAAAVDSAEFKVDKTGPTITDLGPTASPNANGWYKDDVTNRFKATDSLSGIDSDCATAYPDNGSGDRVQSKTTSGEGTAVKVSSDPCTDQAGNTAAAVNSAEFKIDKTAPSITDLGPTTSPNANGWYKDNVTNRFKATDSLSGIDSACASAYPDNGSGDRIQSKTTSGEGEALKVTSHPCTDDAGNTSAAIDSAQFKVDKTAPSITDLGPTTSPNANGWYKDDVTNRFKASDSLSGLDSDCLTAYPADAGDRVQSKTTSGEGAALKVSSDPCSDQAGNTAASVDSAEFKVDKTAPSITDLGPTTDPNANGWYNTDVTNRFKASDSLSGPDSDCLAAYPADGGDRVQSKTTTGEGTDRKVTSDPCTDDAGNTAAAIDSAQFKVDKSKPSSHADSPSATNQSPFTVGYTANDQAALSGLTKVEFYVRTPASGTDYVLVALDSTPSGSGESFSYTPDAGEGTYRFYTLAYDAAGNQEASPVTYDTVTDIETGTPDTTTIFDQTPPVTTDNADADWHKTAVTVTLTPTDETSGSGVDKTYYKVDLAASFTEGTSVVVPAPANHSNDGTHTVSYYSTDKAGNQEPTKTATVKIDTTAPTVQYVSASPAANSNGWRKVDVTATFQATDNASGFDGPSSTKTDTATTTGEGSSVTVGSPVFTDRAGNTASAGTAVSDPFKIDKTNPTLNPVVTPNPIVLGGAASVASNAADVLSTLDTQSCGALSTSTVGQKSVTCTATDKAGNSDSKSVTYNVQYGWGGFLQPINDTAHQTGLTQSRFKLGSTIPAKFVLKNSAGQVVQQATNPTFSRTNRLRACDSVGTTEPTTGDLAADNGASYAWDGSQYHYNWSTKGIKDTGVYRIYANLADSSQRWVDICLW